MVDKELLEQYGEDYLKAYQKTTQYQFDLLAEQLKNLWASTGLEPYLHRVAAWISRRL